MLWGGREGYDTLLNTDIKQEKLQLGRFLTMVVEHKHKIGFKGTILIEPKPHEPTKHQYDFDVDTIFGFLKTHGLENDVKVNIEIKQTRDVTIVGNTLWQGYDDNIVIEDSTQFTIGSNLLDRSPRYNYGDAAQASLAHTTVMAAAKIAPRFIVSPFPGWRVAANGRVIGARTRFRSRLLAAF